MQMIDVIKRLAELDSQNPNIVKENLGIDECGPMGMMGGMEKPSTPATINITAGSGEELSDMLGAIMKLAGVKQVGADDLGIEPEPMTLTAEPVSAVGGHSAGDEMRSVIDKMHNAGGEDDSDNKTDDAEEETDEGSYSNSPADPTKSKSFSSNEFADQENSTNVGNRMDGNMPKGNATFESLMSEYQEFIAEGKECKVCEKPVKKCTCD
jgi:hypothetical protein